MRNTIVPVSYFIAIIAALLIYIGYGYVAPTFEESQTPDPVVVGTGTSAGKPGVDTGAALDLSNAGLGKVPSYVFDRTALTKLDLSGNDLEGALQAEIRHLKNLVELDLSGNAFTGVPAEIGQLSDLRVLNLANNKLTGLPHELGNLSNLELLDLSGNAVSEADLSVIISKLPSTTIIVR